MKEKTLPKLYQYNVCPFCWKVRALLSYKKIPYETVEVHPLNKKEISFSKDYRKVPIFIGKGGEQVNDSTPIMKYIDEQYSANPVFEKEGEGKKIEEKWLKWADATLVRALPPLIYRNLSDSIKAFDYITQVEKFSRLQQALIKYSGAAVMTLVAKKSAKSQGIADPEKHLQKCLKDWEKALGEEDYLGGKKPNGADLAVFGILKSIEGLPAFRFIEENQKVSDWFFRVDQKALKAA
ncbi:MAG: glutathione S-transferase N-terminal domain-containing protein [bacterium]